MKWRRRRLCADNLYSHVITWAYFIYIFFFVPTKKRPTAKLFYFRFHCDTTSGNRSQTQFSQPTPRLLLSNNLLLWQPFTERCCDIVITVLTCFILYDSWLCIEGQWVTIICYHSFYYINAISQVTLTNTFEFNIVFLISYYRESYTFTADIMYTTPRKNIVVE